MGNVCNSCGGRRRSSAPRAVLIKPDVCILPARTVIGLTGVRGLSTPQDFFRQPTSQSTTPRVKKTASRRSTTPHPSAAEERVHGSDFAMVRKVSYDCDENRGGRGHNGCVILEFGRKQATSSIETQSTKGKTTLPLPHLVLAPTRLLPLETLPTPSPCSPCCGLGRPPLAPSWKMGNTPKELAGTTKAGRRQSFPEINLLGPGSGGFETGEEAGVGSNLNLNDQTSRVDASVSSCVNTMRLPPVNNNSSGNTSNVLTQPEKARRVSVISMTYTNSTRAVDRSSVDISIVDRSKDLQLSQMTSIFEDGKSICRLDASREEAKDPARRVRTIGVNAKYNAAICKNVLKRRNRRGDESCPPIPHDRSAPPRKRESQDTASGIYICHTK